MYSYAIMNLLAISEITVTFWKASTWIVWDAAEYVDLTFIFDKIICDVVNPKGLWPKVLTDNQHFFR